MAGNRLENMHNGVTDLLQWLNDLMRLGLAEVVGGQPESCQHRASRLVDAQVPGLANMVRELPTLFKLENGPKRVSDVVGEAYLLSKAFLNREHLPENLQQDLLSRLGMYRKKQDILNLAGIEDTWLVLGRKIEPRDRFNEIRTWVLGSHTKRFGLLLDFEAYPPVAPVPNYPPWSNFFGELAFYPSACPLRALRKDQRPLKQDGFAPPGGCYCLEELLDLQADALASNPFLGIFPALMDEVQWSYEDGNWYLFDQEAQEIPLHPAFDRGWEALAFAGGGTVTVFGEWFHNRFRPLSMMNDQRFLPLTTQESITRPLRSTP